MRLARRHAWGWLVLLGGLCAAGQSTGEERLAQRFQDWLDLVAYHIQPVEKDVFLKLSDDRDRDIFIETFWKQRDPTPGTPENEYRDELLKRFQSSNKLYGRAATREGWKTDMGRIHMVLGPPASIERFEAAIGLVPCQSWNYSGDPRRSLPAQFVLLFYQRGGVGEYRLYDPVSDGPARLLLNQRDIDDPFDYASLYERIRELSPTLADAAISRIPGEHGTDRSPSPRNAMLLADILESPKNDVNLSYATHFLAYKGLVSTEYLTNYVESSTQTAQIDDPVTGLRFFHFSMVPAEISVDYYAPKSEFYCNFQLDVSLRNGEEIIFQYSREWPLYFSEDAWAAVKAGGLAIEESFPIAEGTYRLYALLTNTVGKQFSLLEETVEVLPAGSKPSIDGPVLGYKFENYPSEVHIPFKVLDKKLVVDPRRIYASTEGIAIHIGVRNPAGGPARGGEVRIAVRGLRKANPVHRTFAVRLGALDAGTLLSIPYAIPAADLEPDDYEIAVSLIGAGGEVLDGKKDMLTVSPARAVGHPVAKAKGIPLANEFLFRYMLAEQFEKTGRPESARMHYEEAYRRRPEYLDGVVRYASFLNKTGAFGAALKVAEDLRMDERRGFAFHAIRGQALSGLERYEAASTELEQANRIYNSETAVLNALGSCYQKLGRRAEALEAFKASLKLNPEQPEIRKAIEALDR